MSFDASLLAGLAGIVPTVPSLPQPIGDNQKTPQATDGTASSLVPQMSPVSPRKIERSEKKSAPSPIKAPAPTKHDRLAESRAAYWSHLETCPTCREGWKATTHCQEHDLLWKVYESLMDRPRGQRLAEIGKAKGPPSRPPATHGNGYRMVVTAHTRPLAWQQVRDAYHAHLMTCPTCKPSGMCKEGRQLKREYELITQDNQSG